MSEETPADVSEIRSMPYRVKGTLFLGFKITLGISKCSASDKVEFIQFSITFEEMF